MRTSRSVRLPGAARLERPPSGSARSRRCRGGLGRGDRLGARHEKFGAAVVCSRVVAGGEHRQHGRLSQPEANHNWSVSIGRCRLHRPRCSASHQINAACTSYRPLSRISRPTTSAPAPLRRSSTSTEQRLHRWRTPRKPYPTPGSGPSVIPRMSLALKIPRLIIK